MVGEPEDDEDFSCRVLEKQERGEKGRKQEAVMIGQSINQVSCITYF